MYRLLLLFLLASCVGGQEKVTSSGSAGGNPNAPSRWPINAFPKTVGISNLYTAGEVSELRRAATSWSTTVGNGANFYNIPATLVTDKSNVANLDSLLDNQMAIYKATTWHHDLPATALAVTQIFGVRQNTGSANEYVQIIEADVLVNWTYTYYPTVNSGYDLFSVVLHELGHFLGLAHVYDYTLSSVMFPTIGYSTVFSGPGSNDISLIRSRYGLGGAAPMAAAGRELAQAEVALTPEDVLNSGNGVRILMELHADGTCVHKEDGIVVGSHPVNLKH